MLRIGLNYIRFAVEEPNLFCFLFQSGFAAHNSLLEMVNSEELTPVISAMQEAMNMNIEQTKEVIVIYCVLQSLANSLNIIIGIEYSASAIFCILQAVSLFIFIQKNSLLERYGLYKFFIPARKFLYYVPLFILITRNLWNGVAVKRYIWLGIFAEFSKWQRGRTCRKPISSYRSDCDWLFVCSPVLSWRKSVALYYYALWN